jgi:hypothetical protein
MRGHTSPEGPQSMKGNDRRPLPQFTVGQLLILVSCVCVCLAAPNWPAHRVRNELPSGNVWEAVIYRQFRLSCDRVPLQMRYKTVISCNGDQVERYAEKAEEVDPKMATFQGEDSDGCVAYCFGRGDRGWVRYLLPVVSSRTGPEHGSEKAPVKAGGE